MGGRRSLGSGRPIAKAIDVRLTISLIGTASVTSAVSSGIGGENVKTHLRRSGKRPRTMPMLMERMERC